MSQITTATIPTQDGEIAACLFSFFTSSFKPWYYPLYGLPMIIPPPPAHFFFLILCSASASSTWSDNDSHRLLGLRYHDVLKRFDRVLTRSVPTTFSFGGNVLIDASEQSVVAFGGFFLAAGCWCFAPVIRESGASPYIVS